MDISQSIINFVAIGLSEGKILPLDKIYRTNQLLALVGEKEIDLAVQPTNPLPAVLDVLDELVESAVKIGRIEDLQAERDVLEAKIMNLFVPLPSIVNDNFWRKYRENSKKATDYFYQLSKESNYIKTRSIAKNIEYVRSTEFGDLQITINLSKPEKDSKQIALARKETISSYPSCLLCMENEGYEGHLNHPGRANHRLIRMTLNNEVWGFQYSPYAYYNEHSIFLSFEHRPMQVDEVAYHNLLTIVETFPHYFVGSNAGLPIVGGSILTHDHYQGGRHTFPMEEAEIISPFDLKEFPLVESGIVKWPMSVIRLRSKDKESLTNAGAFVLKQWESYTDEAADILAFSDGEPHNAITPIARQKEGVFELDLVLRNNRTSEEFPDGIFHPHPEVQHIKRENIGLIEVMGLAILPPRLKEELKEVEEYLLGRSNEIAGYHKEWADSIKKKEVITLKNVQQVVQENVGDVFLEVLKDAGVFKTTEKGKADFLRFIEQLKK